MFYATLIFRNTGQISVIFKPSVNGSDTGFLLVIPMFINFSNPSSIFFRRSSSLPKNSTTVFWSWLLVFFQEPLIFRQHNFGKANYPFFHFFQFFFINLKRLLKKKYFCFFSKNSSKIFHKLSSESGVVWVLFLLALCVRQIFIPQKFVAFFLSFRKE